MDVFSFQIEEEGWYQITVKEGPDTIGIWHITDDIGNGLFRAKAGPEETVEYEFEAGTYTVSVGTAYESGGNTGL